MKKEVVENPRGMPNPFPREGLPQNVTVWPLPLIQDGCLTILLDLGN